MSQIENFCGSETPPRLMSTKNLLNLDYVISSSRSMRRSMARTDNFGFVLKYHFRTDLGLSEMNAEIRNDHGMFFIFSFHTSPTNLADPFISVKPHIFYMVQFNLNILKKTSDIPEGSKDHISIGR